MAASPNRPSQPWNTYLITKQIAEHIRANKTYPDGRPMLANNISPFNAHLILERHEKAHRRTRG
jgi:hypothetical protein